MPEDEYTPEPGTYYQIPANSGLWWGEIQQDDGKRARGLILVCARCRAIVLGAKQHDEFHAKLEICGVTPFSLSDLESEVGP